MNNLYHYCSTDTFFKILNSRSIWMSDIFSMNDYFEFIWLLEIAQKNENSKFYKMILNKFQDKISNDNFIFISCFSESEDLLSQWRGYSDDGKGFSIGFDREKLKELGILEKVIYSSLDNIPTHILEKSEELSKSNIGLAETTYKYNQIIEDSAPIVKNYKFSEELEWRLIKKINKNSDLSDIKWRNDSTKLIPYIENVFNYDLINKIIIGPKNNTSIENLKFFLKSIGFVNIEVNKSEISYR